MNPLLFVVVLVVASIAAQSYASKIARNGNILEESLFGWRKVAMLAGDILCIGGVALTLFFSGVLKGVVLWNSGVALGIFAVAVSYVLTAAVLFSQRRR